MKPTVPTLVVLAACSSSAREPIRPSPFVDHEKWQAKAEEVTFSVGPRKVPGTIIVPTGDGPFPAVLLLAGSGPTDRDWNTPLIPTGNGSAKLLANRLARHGAIVLRFDKAGTGKNPGPPLPEWTMDTYRDEGVAALALLRARKDVRADRIFIAGHSEGAAHATRVASVTPDLSGVIYLSPMVRSMVETVMTQLENQYRNPLSGLSEGDIQRELTSVRQAFTDFAAGKQVDPAKSSQIPAVQALVAQLVEPTGAPLMRALISFDNSIEAPKLAVPMLIVSGAKDVQIDPQLDVAHFEKALRGAKREVTVALAPDADHVLKHETRTVAEIRAEMTGLAAHYNAEGRTLDDASVKAIIEWLLPRTK
jgi:pimeloyl-ACP methyl ester carboxylesterase